MATTTRPRKPARRATTSPRKGRAKSAAKKGAAKRGPRSGRQGKTAAAVPAGAPQENPQAKALAQRIAALVADKKASEVLILDVRGKTSYADYFVIASGDSERQVTAMAQNVEEKLKEEAGTRPIGTEGYDTGHWVLLDYGEVVAHLFYTEVRAFYDLEGLWADVPREKVA